MTRNCPEVAVLLCTFNGARYLAEQVRSILDQTHPAISLYISDDGSQDDTCDIVQTFFSASPQSAIDLRTGPGRGATSNFLSLICDSDISADYFAFADQDDVWDADKLSRAIAKLAECDASRPALYCARTRSVTESGSIIGFSPSFRRMPSFSNAIVQNIGGGNTMVINRVARDLLCAAGMVDAVSHDWWTYLLVSGAGGRVESSIRTPCLDYRQHPGNLIGANHGVSTRRLSPLLLKCAQWQESAPGVSANLRCPHAIILRCYSPRRVRCDSRVFEQCVQDRRACLCRLRGQQAEAGPLCAERSAATLGLFVASLLKKI